MAGVTQLRRKLRRMDPAITADLRKVVQSGLTEIERDAIGLAPRDQGDLMESITTVLSRDGMTGLVGPGARAAEIVRRRSGSPFGAPKYRLSNRNKAALMQFFKGYWHEFGTKGHTRTIRGRGPRNIPPLPARPFMTPAYDANRQRIRRAVQTAITRILRRVAAS